MLITAFFHFRHSREKFKTALKQFDVKYENNKIISLNENGGNGTTPATPGSKKKRARQADSAATATKRSGKKLKRDKDEADNAGEVKNGDGNEHDPAEAAEEEA